MTLIEKLINEHNQAVQYTEESQYKDGFLSGMKKAIDIVKKHKGWISVDDRLPTEKDGFVFSRNSTGRKEVEVMVYTPKSTDSCISIDNFILGENYFLFDKYTDLVVTHWQPLPKAPTS